jgi:8-oxo-dGTP diphosphatase
MTHSSKSGSAGGTPIVKNTSYGGVPFDESGRVLLREPAGHYDGYHWTFAKGRIDPAEGTAEAVALREVFEETGYHAEIRGRVPGTFKGSTGQNIYFIMWPKGSPEKPGPETVAVRWATPQEARELIAQTTNAIGRRRDLDVLEAALTACGADAN